ncbi:MAG: hypothetical protein ACREL1_00375 [bacterium]
MNFTGFRHSPLSCGLGYPMFLFDIHDNLKDDTAQGSIDSSQSASEGAAGGSTQSFATGNLEASDEASISNSNNVTNNVLDPGAIAAGQAIAQSGLNDALQAFESGNETIQAALEANTKIATQQQQGGLATGLTSVGWIAAILFGVWAAYKVLVAIFTSGRKEATA